MGRRELRAVTEQDAPIPRVVYLMMAFKPDLSDAGDPSSPAYHKELALSDQVIAALQAHALEAQPA